VYAVLKYDFEESVGCWITSTSHTMRRALDVELAKENITIRQWEVLAWLSFQGDLSQVELADKLGIEAPTLAGVLTRMERDGWLERYNCERDRRKKRIRTTSKAEAVWARMVECCLRVREKAIEGISSEDLACLKRTCETMRLNLEQVAGVTDCIAVVAAQTAAADDVA
jgi:DNA-binding MarR family transcriptional regulator